MIECIFSLDYEIYGNGEGSLGELVFEPARKLKGLFDNAAAKLVVFVEAAEMEKIGDEESDPAIHDVERQIREFHREGHEIALHLHPQWYNAVYENGKWNLDYAEYNLCTLPVERISAIIDRSISYLRKVVDASEFTPVSFRAGNWLFQPAADATKILAARGVKIDSSVFKGGVQHLHRLDYRRATRNGYYWKFEKDVNVADPRGLLLELPIYTQMVPIWKMLTAKRVGLQQKASVSARTTVAQKICRLLDFARFWHPLKFDFCRMTLDELVSMVNHVMQQDTSDPSVFRPLVAIGHTKDLVDFDTVASFLEFLTKNGIRTSTFEGLYPRCR